MPWVWFVTLTFDPSRHGWGPENEEKQVRSWLTRIDQMEAVACPTPAPTMVSRVFAAGAWELTHRGARHLHILVGGCPSVLRIQAKEIWYSMAGIARVLPFRRSSAEACSYLYKYVTKNANLGNDCGPWWWRLEIPVNGIVYRSPNNQGKGETNVSDPGTDQ